MNLILNTKRRIGDKSLKQYCFQKIKNSRTKKLPQNNLKSVKYRKSVPSTNTVKYYTGVESSFSE